MKFLHTADLFVCFNLPYVDFFSCKLFNTIDHFRPRRCVFLIKVRRIILIGLAPRERVGQRLSNDILYIRWTPRVIIVIFRVTYSSDLLSKAVSKKVYLWLKSKFIHQGRGSLTDRGIGSSCSYGYELHNCLGRQNNNPLHHRPSLGHWAGWAGCPEPAVVLDRQIWCLGQDVCPRTYVRQCSWSSS